MRYRVRTPEGELGYATLQEVASAYTQGLVGPEDEVCEAGGPWRKAASVPELARVRPVRRSLLGRAQVASMVLVLGLGASALRLLFADSWRLRLLGLALVLAASSMLTRIMYRAYRR